MLKYLHLYLRFRRYNISTDDYEPFATDATFNQVKWVQAKMLKSNMLKTQFTTEKSAKLAPV